MPAVPAVLQPEPEPEPEREPERERQPEIMTSWGGPCSGSGRSGPQLELSGTDVLCAQSSHIRVPAVPAVLQPEREPEPEPEREREQPEPEPQAE